jgi:hypothetical protein
MKNLTIAFTLLSGIERMKLKSLTLLFISFHYLIFCQNPMIEWEKCFGGSSNDNANSIITTNDGGYIFSGLSGSNNGDITSFNGGSSDYWIVKLDSIGNLIWQKSIGGTSTDVCWSIKSTLDGGYVLAGRTMSNDVNVSGNHGSSDCWIVKLDAQGIIIWQKCFGGSSIECAYDIISCSDGGYVFTGYTASNNGDIAGNHGGNDLLVVKLNSNGTTL